MATGYTVTINGTNTIPDNSLWAGDAISSTGSTIDLTTATRLGAGTATVTGTVDGMTLSNQQIGGAYYAVGTDLTAQTIYFVPDATTVSLTSATVGVSPVYAPLDATVGTNSAEFWTSVQPTMPENFFLLGGNDRAYGSNSTTDLTNAGGERDTD